VVWCGVANFAVDKNQIAESCFPLLLFFTMRPFQKIRSPRIGTMSLECIDKKPYLMKLEPMIKKHVELFNITGS
jgi:hypothetical protein